MDNATDLTTLLNRLQDQIRTGQVVLVLGPNTGSDARTVSGTSVLSQSQFVDAIRREFALTNEDGAALSLDEILDYCLSIPDGKERLETLIRAGFTCRVPGSLHRTVPNFVWHRIYSFDISDALELAYRQNLHRSQSLIKWVLGDPITPPRELSDRVELIKLYGDAEDPHRENFLTTPGYLNRSARSRWYDQMLNDLETHPTVFLGEDGDLPHLIGAFRRTTLSTGSTYLVTSQIGGLQARTVQNLPIQHLAISPSEFFAAVHAAMPAGRDIGGILSDTAAMPISSDPRLAATLLSDFEILTGEQLRRLSAAHTEPRGGIRRFYRGEDVRWSDISDNVIADITPYKNFRGRINNELNKGFPGGTLFVLLSPAGMGKTVGLMSTAYWLRQQVNLPLLWFRSEGDLGSFFHRVRDTDFDQGAFIIIDDIAIYTADLEDVRPEVLRKFCFIATSRETRWLRYGSRIKAKVDRVIEEQIRQINNTDATDLRDKIAQFGTLIHFEAATRDAQVAEVLARSGRDLLVLIRELGQGEKFETILQSEVDELSDEQRFCYFLVCIPDRIQVPLPRDLLRRAVLEEYPSVNFTDLVAGLGRLVRYSSGSTAVRSRHSVIAARVVEDPKRRDSALRRKAVEGYYKAFSHYQIPIIVHHSNTAHARVFKAVVNNRFLAQIFGTNEAIEIYKTYEKAFEKDAFYWQQFGLCYLRAKQHELAIETLAHAATLHDNPLIRHSLGVAKLTACLDLGPAGLGPAEFDAMRAEGKQELEALHALNGAREDIAIVSLAALDLRIARTFDPKDKLKQTEREYHTTLAFYLRANPNKVQAREVYDKLNGALLGTSEYVDLSDEDAVDIDI